MKPIVLDLPGAEIISNNLHDILSVDWLDEDLVFVRLPDGTKVDVGWHGDPDADGFFKIVQYKTSWNSPFKVLETNDVGEVVEILRSLNRQSGVPARAISATYVKILKSLNQREVSPGVRLEPRTASDATHRSISLAPTYQSVELARVPGQYCEPRVA